MLSNSRSTLSLTTGSSPRCSPHASPSIRALAAPPSSHSRASSIASASPRTPTSSVAFLSPDASGGGNGGGTHTDVEDGDTADSSHVRRPSLSLPSFNGSQQYAKIGAGVAAPMMQLPATMKHVQVKRMQIQASSSPMLKLNDGDGIMPSDSPLADPSSSSIDDDSSSPPLPCTESPILLCITLLGFVFIFCGVLVGMSVGMHVEPAREDHVAVYNSVVERWNIAERSKFQHMSFELKVQSPTHEMLVNANRQQQQQQSQANSVTRRLLQNGGQNSTEYSSSSSSSTAEPSSSSSTRSSSDSSTTDSSSSSAPPSSTLDSSSSTSSSSSSSSTASNGTSSSSSSSESSSSSTSINGTDSNSTGNSSSSSSSTGTNSTSSSSSSGSTTDKSTIDSSSTGIIDSSTGNNNSTSNNSSSSSTGPAPPPPIPDDPWLVRNSTSLLRVTSGDTLNDIGLDVERYAPLYFALNAPSQAQRESSGESNLITPHPVSLYNTNSSTSTSSQPSSDPSSPSSSLSEIFYRNYSLPRRWIDHEDFSLDRTMLIFKGTPVGVNASTPATASSSLLLLSLPFLQQDLTKTTLSICQNKLQGIYYPEHDLCLSFRQLSSVCIRVREVDDAELKKEMSRLQERLVNASSTTHALLSQLESTSDFTSANNISSTLNSSASTTHWIFDTSEIEGDWEINEDNEVMDSSGSVLTSSTSIQPVWGDAVGIATHVELDQASLQQQQQQQQRPVTIPGCTRHAGSGWKVGLYTVVPIINNTHSNSASAASPASFSDPSSLSDTILLSLRLSSFNISIRSRADPYLMAQSLTHSSLWFGFPESELILFTVLLVFIGTLLELVPCYYAAKWYTVRKTREMMNVQAEENEKKNCGEEEDEDEDEDESGSEEESEDELNLTDDENGVDMNDLELGQSKQQNGKHSKNETTDLELTPVLTATPSKPSKVAAAKPQSSKSLSKKLSKSSRTPSRIASPSAAQSVVLPAGAAAATSSMNALSTIVIDPPSQSHSSPQPHILSATEGHLTPNSDDNNNDELALAHALDAPSPTLSLLDDAEFENGEFNFEGELDELEL